MEIMRRRLPTTARKSRYTGPSDLDSGRGYTDPGEPRQSSAAQAETESVTVTVTVSGPVGVSESVTADVTDPRSLYPRTRAWRLAISTGGEAEFVLAVRPEPEPVTVAVTG